MDAQLYKEFKIIEKAFWSEICENNIRIGDHTHCFMTPMDAPIFNFIYLRQGASENTFQQASTLFSSQKKGHMLVLPESLLPEFEEIIKKAGYTGDGMTTAMYLSLSDATYPPYKNNPCDIILTNHDLKQWAQPLKTAFPVGDDTITNEYIRYHQKALDNGATILHYALLVAGQPVSSLTLTLHAKLARFDDIGTDIAYQGNGYATHLITHVLEFCREQGVERCFLDASADGLALYRKFGFKPLFNYLSFINE
ncbi:TPA: GNAT family N-acetyltransferase [Proteus mirabilis]|uniref:GNAT family N-acetyltransferase n=1 Tax=Proteus mirabilis TaxID=584 RepID=UPI0013D14B34|nr:GNAT family N-acetyltransferase [Proteus mirabilis]EKT8673024.1 GNAT family N-acetyltransferase [Proteus mirabilis]MBG3075235.1 GNAT family N-acetyltransferase [Proteus mirabilis]MBG3125543.1 GNAT family N-acetyltransferase [Proteus mirabilis]MBI6384752.1 GNAT family N-acetyltransferase [Proteus mirabilis]HEK0383880.1 GNAT family N-acetyltransferase [Proteus mirabilis]